MVNSNIRCCHAAYKYDSVTGVCEFIYSSGLNVILRDDRINKKYIYIRVRYFCMHAFIDVVYIYVAT